MNPRDDMLLESGKVYMDHAAIGPLPKNSILELQYMYNSMARKGSGAIDLEYFEKFWQEIRTNFAEIIHGDPRGVAITSNTASGLHIVADGIQTELDKLSNIVITDLEFITNSYVWQQLVNRYGIELRVVEFDHSSNSFDGWSDKIDDNTTLVALSHVQYSNGYRADIDYVCKLAHEHGAKVSIDAIQSLGVVPLDVSANNVDYVATGGYKWLLGPHGTGLFYIRPDLIDDHQSILVGMFSDENIKQFTHHNYSPWDDARRYQITMSPLYSPLNESLKIINKWDPQKNLDHVLKLQDYLLREIEKLENFTNNSDFRDKNRSGILSLDHDEAEKIIERLNQHNITVSLRDGAIRIAPHRYNNFEELDKLVSILKKH